MTPAPSPFELWAQNNGYDIAPAVLPAADRTYAARDTQAAFDAWNASAADTLKAVTDSAIALLTVAVSE